MKALTVQQPWAWSIVHGGKNVENRTTPWSYRGPLAIHAGARWSQRGGESSVIRNAFARWCTPEQLDRRLDPAEHHERFEMGAIIGVVDLVDVHDAWPGHRVTTISGTVQESDRCCPSAWGEFGATLADRLVHLELANPRPLAEPIQCKGRLGLWTPPAEVLEQLDAVVP